MRRLKSSPYNLLIMFFAVLWLFLVVYLQICDVWDETDLLLNNLTAPGTAELIQFLWTHPIYFYRPLGASIVGVASRLLDYDVAWRVLRLLNAALLLGTVSCLLMGMRKWGGDDRKRDLLFTVLFLYSGSGIMGAGWFPVIFDAGVVFLLAAGLLALAHDRPVFAGVLLGVAFLFKESAAMGFPLILGTWLMGKIDAKALVRSLFPMTLIGGLYWGMRSNLIPLGSSQDIHGFQPDLLIPTAIGWLQSFWYQSISQFALPHLGGAWLLISLLFFREKRGLLTSLLLIVPPIFLYWGMFVLYWNDVLMTAAHFQGRLYLVPAALLLFWLAVWGKRTVLFVLLFPVLLGGARTYTDHLKFQRCYAQIYELQSATERVTVHYPEKALDDWRRKIRIGAYPSAAYRVNAKTGTILASP